MARKRTTKKKYKQVLVVGTDKKRDRARAAKDVGWRISDKTGRRYFENRSNRSDTEKEQKYHGGVNRRATPSKSVKQTSTRASRSMKTTRRVAPVRKLDPQKRYLKIVNKITPAPDSYEGIKKYTIYPKTKNRVLSKGELMQLIVAEMRLIDNRNVEHGVAIDKYGNIRVRSVGDVKSVKFPGIGSGFWNADTIKDEIILIHNHPGNSVGWNDAQVPLSEQDIKISTKLSSVGCKGIIACNKGRYFACLNSKPKYTPAGAKGRATRCWNAAVKQINADWPEFERQKPNETREAYDKRWNEYDHKRDMAICNLASQNLSKVFISDKGYKYIDKRY